MFLAIIFLAFGILAWVAVGVLIYFRSKQLGKTEVMRSTETSQASDAATAAPGTLVEVKGTLRCEDPLTSEMSERTCAYYLSQVIREYRETDRDSDGKTTTRRRSEVVASNEQFAPFAVEDDSGAIGVKAEDAEVDAMEVVNRFEKDDGSGRGSITLGGFTVNLGGGEQTIGYRHVEKILPVDAAVYVLGPVGHDDEIAASGDERFIISYRSEEQLEKKYKKDALTLALVAAGLFVFGLIFVGVGVAAAVGAI
ncbi:MAG: E3 ubiquitin ligase family protein [Rubrobacteraceae bacterium]